MQALKRYLAAALLGVLLGLAVCTIVERVASIAQAALTAPGPEQDDAVEYVPTVMDY